LRGLVDAICNTLGRAGAGFHLCAVADPPLARRLRDASRGEPLAETRENRRDVWANKMVAYVNDPYSVCLPHPLKLALDFTAATQRPLEMFVSHKPGHTERAADVYAGAFIYPPFVGRLSGLHNGKHLVPESSPALQAADLVAYYLGQSLRRQRYG